MKTEVCRKCKHSECVAMDWLNVNKETCHSYQLKCTKKDYMECRYVRECPLGEGGSK